MKLALISLFVIQFLWFEVSAKDKPKGDTQDYPTIKGGPQTGPLKQVLLGRLSEVGTFICMMFMKMKYTFISKKNSKELISFLDCKIKGSSTSFKFH